MLVGATPPSNADDLDQSPPTLAKREKGNDWPHFLGPNRDGKSTEKGIRTDWTNGQLPLVWSRKLATSYGIGSVAAGRYLSFERYGDQERLTCLNAETGAELWRAEQPVQYRDMYGYNNGPRASPTIDGGRVYTMGVAGRLSCVALGNGSLLWSHDLHERFSVVQNFFGASACPLVIGDLVVVMVGGSPPEDQKIPPGQLDRVSPAGSALVAFDKRTGVEVWRGGDDLASYSSPIPITIEGKLCVLVLAREGLLCVDAQTGKQLWHYPFRAGFLESVNAAVPVVRGNQVLISECYQVGSVLLEVSLKGATAIRQDPANRREQTLRAHWATPIELDGYLFGCSGRNEPDSDLRCIAWSTGKPQWIDPRRVRTSLLSIDGHFVVLEEFGLLQLIKANPKKLEVVTSIDLSQPQAGGLRFSPPCWAAPIVSHGLMYVRGEQELACYELIAN